MYQDVVTVKLIIDIYLRLHIFENSNDRLIGTIFNTIDNCHI